MANFQQYKGTAGQAPWYSTIWTPFIDAVESSVTANETAVNALQAVTNGSFGLSAGTVSISVKQPSNIHTKLDYPGGTDFSINNYPQLYANVADKLTDFTAIASGTVADLYGAVYNDSRLIAAGVNKGIYSLDDGENWSSASVAPGGVMRAIAANGLTGASALVVAVGDGDVISLTSGVLAGDSWATQTSPVLDSAFNWSDVVWMAGTVNKFVAIGNKETSPGVYESKITSSADGATWAVEKTIAGRFESIAYNDNDGGSNEFVIVGWPLLGSTHSAQKSTSLSGTYTNVTVNGAAGAGGSPSMNSVVYWNAGAGGIYVYCGPFGVTGYMTMGSADFTSFVTVTGTPNLNRAVADSTENAIFVLGDLTGGLAYIYKVDTSGWVQEGVGSYALHGYVNTGTARIVTGNGGTVFRTTGAAPGDFTVPYPSSVALSSPFSYWVLTEDVATSGGGATSVGSGDLSKLATGWFYVKVKTTTTDYIRCFAQNSDGVLVCGGDNGLLCKSIDYGSSWVDIGTSLSIVGNVNCLDFTSVDILLVSTSSNFYAISADFSTVIKSAASSDSFSCASNQLSGYFNDAVQLRLFSGTGISVSVFHPSPTYGTALSVGVSASAAQYKYLDGKQPFGLKPLFKTNGHQLFPVNNSTGDMYYCSVDHDRSYSTYTVATSTASDAFISGFIAKNHGFSELYNELIVVGSGGKAFSNSLDFTSGFNQITTGITFDIEDVAFIAGAWVMLTRRGCLYTTDSATVTNLTSSDASITAKPAGNALISIPTQFRLVANDLGFPGYVRVCQL
jgi:hypothetical protein